jgi:hypothetical protein
LRTIVESEGNQAELIADIIGAISDIVLRHPRWVDLGLQWLEAFDQINLAAIRRAAKAAGAHPLHSAVMTLICVDLKRSSEHRSCRNSPSRRASSANRNRRARSRVCQAWKRTSRPA